MGRGGEMGVVIVIWRFLNLKKEVRVLVYGNLLHGTAS